MQHIAKWKKSYCQIKKKWHITTLFKGNAVLWPRSQTAYLPGFLIEIILSIWVIKIMHSIGILMIVTLQSVSNMHVKFTFTLTVIQGLKGLRKWKFTNFFKRKWKFTNFFNPLLPIAYKSARIVKISILKLEGIIKKISYERRDYESVEEKSLSKAMSQKTTKKEFRN